jgi:hypothetical protein
MLRFFGSHVKFCLSLCEKNMVEGAEEEKLREEYFDMEEVNDESY